jgi:hypothetical protein
MDMIATNNNGAPWLLRNESTSGAHWLLVQLEGVRTNRDGLGAEVAVLQPGRKPVWRRSQPDGSYVSASDRRVHFGLGDYARIDGVVVRWVGAPAEVFRTVKADSIAKLREGSGQPW